MYYKDGSSYSGFWKANLYHGKGEFKNSSNSYSGNWIEGKPEKEMKNLIPSKGRIMPAKK